MREEKGFNRLADLMILDELVLNDEWESYSVRFSIYYPMKDCEVMRVQGDSLQLGNWGCKIAGYNDKPGELHAKIMSKSDREERWLTGEYVRPWLYEVKFQ